MKKGFTLIELLAVIVILAIIALIATPIVLNIIKDTKTSTKEISKELYISAVENNIGQSILHGTSVTDGSYIIMSNGNLCNGTISGTTCTGIELKPELNGEKPVCGNITIEKGKITKKQIFLIDENGCETIGQDGNSCKATSGDGMHIGDVITCETESFYVISTDATSIKMFAKYNLNVGPNKVATDTEGLQSINALGANDDGTTPYPGSVAFSNTNGWEAGTDINVRNYEGPVKKALDNYQTILENLGLTVNSVGLITKSELEGLGCNSTCASSLYPWLYSITYWTASSWDDSYVAYVGTLGYIGGYPYTSNLSMGARPVVTIPKSIIIN